MANAGYTVVLDGILGPWHFEPLREELAQCTVSVNLKGWLQDDVDFDLAP